MTALDALDLAHAELIASLAPKLTERRINARTNPTSSSACQLQNSEHFAAGIDHAIRTVRDHLVRLEDHQGPTDQDSFVFTPALDELKPLEFATERGLTP
jgi:hypothetical protein